MLTQSSTRQGKPSGLWSKSLTTTYAVAFVKGEASWNSRSRPMGRPSCPCYREPLDTSSGVDGAEIRRGGQRERISKHGSARLSLTWNTYDASLGDGKESRADP